MPDTVKKHAMFSPSEKSWVNYDRDKIVARYDQVMAVERGTQLHEFAATAIKLKMLLDPSMGVIADYVQDCITLNVETEQEVIYTPEINGTADAIKYDPYENRLYVFDLKTGQSKASIVQLQIYAAIWCAYNGKNPLSMKFDLRIYHNQYPERNCSEEDENLSNRIYDIIEQMNYIDMVVGEIRNGGSR